MATLTRRQVRYLVRLPWAWHQSGVAHSLLADVWPAAQRQLTIILRYLITRIPYSNGVLLERLINNHHHHHHQLGHTLELFY